MSRSLLLLVALAGCSPPASLRAGPLVNGTPSSQASIVAVIHTRPDGSRQLCSGTVISPRVVVTAKHCVFEDVGGTEWVPIPAARLSILLGDDIVGAPGASIAVAAIDTTPGPYHDDDGLSGGDVALLSLAFDAPVPPLPVATAAPATGVAVRLVGFGYTGEGRTGELGIRHEGPASIVSVAAETFTTEGASWTCIGDSGGPALDPSGAVLGVATGGPSGCPASTSISTRLDRHEALLTRAGVTRDAGVPDAASPPDSPGGDAGGAPAASGCACRASTSVWVPGPLLPIAVALGLVVLGRRRL